jgi:pyruvate/2-oxoglutarate dehydrogenase complex dihydrolipoamide dehydrogenase (E3) component
MKRVKARKDEIAGHSMQGVESWVRGLKNGAVYHGHGRFESPRTVRVDGELLEADRVFINVGGARARAAHARVGSGALPYQLEHDGGRFPAGAPDHRRR